MVPTPKTRRNDSGIVLRNLDILTWRKSIGITKREGPAS